MKKALIIASVPSMIEQFNMNNIKILQELGYKVDVATNFQNSGTISKERTEELKKELASINVKCYNVLFSRNPFSLSNTKAYKEIKKIVQEDNHYDIIHMHSPIGGVCGRLACKKIFGRDLKVIYTAHGFHFYKGAPLLNWLLYYPIEKWLSKYTDILITINEEDYNIAKKKFKARKIELVHGVGVDIEKFDFKMSKYERQQLRKSLGLRDDDFVMIYVAELSKRKNQEMLLKTMKKLTKKDNTIKLLLVGKDSLNGKLQKFTIKNKLDNNINFLGYRKDIYKLLKVSDLLVSTSRQEGLPVNVIEGLMSGLWAVVTNCRGNRDLIENGENGYIVKNKKQLIEKILQTKENNDLLYKNNKNYCNMEKYDKKNILEGMKAIYLWKG